MLVEKVKKIKINPRYDISARQMKDLAEGAAGQFNTDTTQLLDAVSLGFKLGYEKGAKAVQKEMTEFIENPKNKNEYKQAIFANIGGIKNVYVLRDILILSDILCRQNLTLLSDDESNISSIFRNIVNCNNSSILNQIRIITSRALSKRV